MREETGKKVAQIVCPHCGKKVIAYRAIAGRVLVTSTAGIALAIVGGTIGASIGIASGGWGIPAKVPLAAIGLVVGTGFGYIVSDKTFDKAKCPCCDGRLSIPFG